MMIAQDMADLSTQYNRDVNELHQIFYEVSCNRDNLIKVLNKDDKVDRWTVLEDLALKGDTQSEAYKHVRSVKSEDAISERKHFLCIE